MAEVKAIVFGLVFPALEILLLLIGLGLLGWQGVVYTYSGLWPALPLAAIWPGPVSGPIWSWLISTPLPSLCIGTSVGLFFVMPPSYAHH